MFPFCLPLWSPVLLQLTVCIEFVQCTCLYFVQWCYMTLLTHHDKDFAFQRSMGTPTAFVGLPDIWLQPERPFVLKVCVRPTGSAEKHQTLCLRHLHVPVGMAVTRVCQ